MFSKTFFIFVIFVAIVHCSVLSDLKKKEESLIAQIWRVTDEGSNNLDSARSNVASKITTTYPNVLKTLDDLKETAAKYEKLAQDAGKSITECNLDETASGRILAANITQILDCINVTTFRQGDAIIDNLNKNIFRVKSVIPDCTATSSTGPSVFENCANERFNNITRTVEKFKQDIANVITQSSATATQCLDNNSKKRMRAAKFSQEQLVNCANNILKK